MIRATGNDIRWIVTPDKRTPFVARKSSPFVPYSPIQAKVICDAVEISGAFAGYGTWTSFRLDGCEFDGTHPLRIRAFFREVAFGVASHRNTVNAVGSPFILNGLMKPGIGQIISSQSCLSICPLSAEEPAWVLGTRMKYPGSGMGKKASARWSDSSYSLSPWYPEK